MASEPERKVAPSFDWAERLENIAIAWREFNRGDKTSKSGDNIELLLGFLLGNLSLYDRDELFQGRRRQHHHWLLVFEHSDLKEAGTQRCRHYQGAYHMLDGRGLVGCRR